MQSKLVVLQDFVGQQIQQEEAMDAWFFSEDDTNNYDDDVSNMVVDNMTLLEPSSPAGLMFPLSNPFEETDRNVCIQETASPETPRHKSCLAANVVQSGSSCRFNDRDANDNDDTSSADSKSTTNTNESTTIQKSSCRQLHDKNTETAVPDGIVVSSSTNHVNDDQENFSNPRQHPHTKETPTIPIASCESTIATAPSSEPAIDFSKIDALMLMDLVTAKAFSENSHQHISLLLLGDSSWNEFFSSLNAKDFSCIIANVSLVYMLWGLFRNHVSLSADGYFFVSYVRVPGVRGLRATPRRRVDR
jgi:hypothetical protein